MNRYFSLRDEVLHLLDEKSHGYYDMMTSQ